MRLMPTGNTPADRRSPHRLTCPMDRYDQFQDFRTRLNEKIVGSSGNGTLVTKRFFALDDQAYRDTSGEGGLDKPTKELLGLSASMVLRCDDCIAYHIDQCVKAGRSDRQIWETFDIALIVGGSIVIPHLRRAVEFLEQCRARHNG
jgi:AhpD family alkylhydroperoxidase